MIHIRTDFYDTVAMKLHSIYFPEKHHLLTTDENYHIMLKALEDFYRGLINYRQLIGRVAKSCNDTTENIHKLIEPSIISFGSYKYKPKNVNHGRTN